MRPRCVAVFFLILVFPLVTGFACAADGQWAVVRDKDGVCAVINSKDKTPETIAGPFDSKKKAEKAKAKLCTKGTETASGKIEHKVGEEFAKVKSGVKTASGKIKHKVGEELAKVKSGVKTASGKIKHKVGEELTKVKTAAGGMAKKAKERLTKDKSSARGLKEGVNESIPPDKKD